MKTKELLQNLYDKYDKLLAKDKTQIDEIILNNDLSTVNPKLFFLLGRSTLLESFLIELDQLRWSLDADLSILLK